MTMEIDESGFHEESARCSLNVGEQLCEFVKPASVNSGKGGFPGRRFFGEWAGLVNEKLRQLWPRPQSLNGELKRARLLAFGVASYQSGKFRLWYVGSGTKLCASRPSRFHPRRQLRRVAGEEFLDECFHHTRSILDSAKSAIECRCDLVRPSTADCSSARGRFGKPAPLTVGRLEADVRKADFKPSSHGDLWGNGAWRPKADKFESQSRSVDEDSRHSMHREITGMV